MAFSSKYWWHAPRVLLYSALIATAPFATSKSVHADTLKVVVQEALETNPELGSLRFNRQAIDQELRAARGLNLPTVDVRGGSGRSRNENVTGSGINTTNNWHKHDNGGVALSQRIFDGFETRSEIERQKNRVDSARWRVADTSNSIALKAIQSYLELQRAIAIRSAAVSNLSALKGLMARVKARVSAGRGTAGEESEAGARLENAKALLVEAQNSVADADALFRSIVGRPPLGSLSAVALPRRPSSIDIAVREAISFAPSILATQHDVRAADAAIDSARSRFFPRLNLELSAENSRGVTEKNDRETDAAAMLVVRWNLFNGGIDRARVTEASARAAEAREISANTERLIEREVRVSWNAMTAAGLRVTFLSRQLELNRATRLTYNQQFDASQRRLLDLLDIQNQVFVSEASLRTEQLVGYFNTFRVLASTGKLVEAMGLSLPEEAIARRSSDIFDDWHTEVHSVSGK